MWDFDINLSFNILERIPNLIEMVLYSFIRVLSDNPNLLIGSPTNDAQLSYLEFFKIKSIYYSEDIMNKYLKNDFFGKLLKDNLRIKHNFDNYLFQENYNAFTNTKKWEKNLNSKGYFCPYIA